MNRLVIGIVTVLLVMGSTAVVWAVDGPRTRGGHMGPPPEAIEACEGKGEGATVEFTNRRGEKVKATCREINGQLRDVPEDGPRGPKGTPSDRTNN